MPSWIILILGLVVLVGIFYGIRQIGKLKQQKKQLKDTQDAALRRKKVDNEVANLSPDELLDRLSGGM